METRGYWRRDHGRVWAYYSPQGTRLGMVFYRIAHLGRFDSLPYAQKVEV